MKKLVTLSFIISSVLVSQVSIAAQEGRYQMRKMECVGKVNQKPKQMHPDYVHMGLKVFYFTPKKKELLFLFLV